MRTLWTALLILGALPGACGAAPADTAAQQAAGRAGIAAFNRALDAATRRMDNAATLALWEDDGVSLLPETPPIAGKKALGKFLGDVMAQLPGARMEAFELLPHDIQVSGDWGSEWCEEHQVVRLAAGKPPFEGRGRMLLVLHRGADGQWRLKEEMWQPAAPPPAAR